MNGILFGTAVQYAAPDGTITLQSGDCILLVIAHASSAGATLSILGGPSIPIPEDAPPTSISFPVGVWTASPSAATVVGTNTDQLFVSAFRFGPPAT